MDQQNHTVESLFIKEHEMPTADLPPYTIVFFWEGLPDQSKLIRLVRLYISATQCKTGHYGGRKRFLFLFVHLPFFMNKEHFLPMLPLRR